MPEPPGRLRSALFTPGTEVARLRKAVQAGADICIFDLEDSVTQGRIDDARETIAQVVPELAEAARIWVRVHAASSSQMAADLAAVPLHLVEGIVLPKVGGKDSVDLCRAGIDAVNGPGDLPLIAIVESAEGVLHAEEIARARAVFCLALGRFDLAADLGVDPDARTPALSAARAMVVLASVAAPGAHPSTRLGSRFPTSMVCGWRLSKDAAMVLAGCSSSTLRTSMPSTRSFRPPPKRSPGHGGSWPSPLRPPPAGPG